MSQTEPEFQKPDRVHTLPIDEAGELIRVGVTSGHQYGEAATVELAIDGDAAADYHVEFGAQLADDRQSRHWFRVPGDYEYTATDSVEDAWVQARQYVRIMVDSPAPADSEARVVIAYGV